MKHEGKKKRQGHKSDFEKSDLSISEPRIPWYRRRLFWTTQERIAHDLAIMAAVILIVYLLFHFVVGIALVDGNSMYPTLRNGQVVFYTRMNHTYETGDVISVRMPSGKFYVKRIVATAGDEVDIKNGSLMVNGNEVDENYTCGVTKEEEGNIEYPLTVEEGKFFILGDNRENSNDSRSFGAIIEERITGKVLFSAGVVQ